MNIFEWQRELNRQNLLLHGQSMHGYLEDRSCISAREAEAKAAEEIRTRIEILEKYLEEHKDEQIQVD